MGVLEADFIKLTYAMCYVYPNKPAAVKVPIPLRCAKPHHTISVVVWFISRLHCFQIETQ